MAALREFLGSRCPHCSNDILQQMPTTNRMPNLDVAWCASCNAQFTVDQLSRGGRGPGLLGKLFGRPHRG